MGTVVFTSAPLKIYLTASAEERARRRFEQLKEKGFGATLATLVEDIRTRDDRDMNREVAPLRPADDAVVIDSTTMTVDDVVNRILDEAAARQLA
jgi:cytidylate kinase